VKRKKKEKRKKGKENKPLRQGIVFTVSSQQRTDGITSYHLDIL